MKASLAQMIVVFTAAFTITYVSVPLLIRIAHRRGWFDRPGERRTHLRPVPRIGGLAVFLGFHCACLLLHAFPEERLPTECTPHCWLVYVLTSAILLIVGLIDDLRGMRPFVKLVFQTAAALSMYGAGMRASQIFGIPLIGPIDAALTVLWFVGIVNAFNLIDGMDGLATGLACIAAFGLAGSLMMRGLSGDALVMLALLGAASAFLRYNFNPATIFLGDSGSMFLGFTIAAVSINTGAKGTLLASLGVPLLAVGVPLFDTALAVWRRSVRRFSASLTGSEAGGITHYDLDHLHHRFLRLGLTQRRVAALLYTADALLVLTGLLSITFSKQAGGIFVLTFVAAAYFVIRHVVYLELWDSGIALIEGFKRLGNSLLMAVLPVLLDLIVLAASLMAAILLMRSALQVPLQAVYRAWSAAVPFYATIPLLALLLSGVYGKVWSRARIADYALLVLALASGVAAAAGITLVISAGHLELSFGELVIYFVCAAVTAVAARALLPLVQDLLSLSAGVAAVELPRSQIRSILVYGAGRRGILYLRSLKYQPNRAKNTSRIVGFIDDDPALRRKLIHGYPVIGGCAELERILVQRKIDEIIVTTRLTDEHLEQLLLLARYCGVAVNEWRAVTRSLIPHKAAPQAVPEQAFWGSDWTLPAAGARR